MARAFCVPGIILLTLALVLNLLSSISLPFLPAIDVVRTTFDSGVLAEGQSDGISQVRFGIWAVCVYDFNSGDRTCSNTGHGYTFEIESPDGSTTRTIGQSWTQGLAIHPVAAAVTFIAFLLSFSEHLTVTLVASLVSFLAAFLTLLAFLVDIALYGYVHNQLGSLPDVDETTSTAPAFWLTFVAFILLTLAGCTVCFGRRRDASSNSYPLSSGGGVFSKFRR